LGSGRSSGISREFEGRLKKKKPKLRYRSSRLLAGCLFARGARTDEDRDEGEDGGRGGRGRRWWRRRRGAERCSLCSMTATGGGCAGTARGLSQQRRSARFCQTRGRGRGRSRSRAGGQGAWSCPCAQGRRATTPAAERNAVRRLQERSALASGSSAISSFQCLRAATTYSYRQRQIADSEINCKTNADVTSRGCAKSSLSELRREEKSVT
jgi:hypothetical protein